MPLAVIAIIKFALAAVITRLILAFGIAFFSADFISSKVNEYLTNAYDTLNASLTSDIAAFLGLMRFDEVCGILTGGIVMAAALKSFTLIYKHI